MVAWIEQIKNKLFTLPYIEDEQSRNAADILNKVLVISLISVLLYSLSMFLGITHLPEGMPNTSLQITLIVVILLVLLRQYRRVEWVSRLFSLSLWTITTASLYTSGGMNVIVLGVYQMVLLFSVFILSPRARNAFFLLCLVSMIGLYAAHLKGWIPEDKYDPSTAFLAQILFLAVMMVFAMGVERSLIRNLYRARQSEREARETEERLRVALDSLPVIVFNHDLDLRYTWMYNDKRLRDPNSIIGKTDADMLDPVSAEVLMSIKSQAIRTGQPVRKEVTFILGGQRQWFDMYVKPLRDAQGRMTGITCAAYNLRERKMAEVALAESELRYRQMFEDSPQPMWVYDLDTLAFLTVNDAAVAHYGFSREEFLKMTIKDIRPPEDLPRLLEDIAQDSSQYGRSGVWRHRTKDRRELFVEISSHRMTFEGRPARLTLVNDVTERHHAEELLRRSESLFHTIFQSVPVAITLTDIEQSTLLNVNDYFVNLIGYDRNDLLATHLQELPIWVSGSAGMHPERLLWDGKEQPREVQWRTKNGAVLDIMISAQRIELGHTPCILGIGIDITERKRTSEQQIAAERMRLQVEQEREVVQLKEQFISRMSHEFRTPIAIILSSKESLQHYYSRLTEERRQEHFNEIDKQIQYILELLEGVLTIGKARAGKMEFLPETIDLVPFCRNLFNQIQLTDDKQHRFVFDAHGTFDGAEMDERLLQHIFVNLLTNAVKYSPTSGEIRFEMDEVDDRARFRISDQGIGMSEQDVSRLGETFFRATNARRYQGTGLGLAIVKENVAAHKGTFHCDSRLNEGTTFTVELPLRMQPARGTATFVAAIPQPNTL